MAALRALRSLRAEAWARARFLPRARSRSAVPGGAAAAPGGAVAVPPRGRLGAEPHEEEPMLVAQRKHPDWHGFSEDPRADLLGARAVLLAGVSITLVLGSLFLAYLPDYGLRQWARREAELQVRARERAGLPLLASDYYDPARLALPTRD